MIRFKTRSGSQYWIDYPRWGRTTRSGGIDHLDSNEGELSVVPEIVVGAGVSMIDVKQGWFTTTPVTEVTATDTDDEAEKARALVVADEVLRIVDLGPFVVRAGDTSFAEALVRGLKRRGYGLVKVVDAD